MGRLVLYGSGRGRGGCQDSANRRTFGIFLKRRWIEIRIGQTRACFSKPGFVPEGNTYRYLWKQRMRKLTQIEARERVSRDGCNKGTGYAKNSSCGDRVRKEFFYTLNVSVQRRAEGPSHAAGCWAALSKR